MVDLWNCTCMQFVLGLNNVFACTKDIGRELPHPWMGGGIQISRKSHVLRGELLHDKLKHQRFASW